MLKASSRDGDGGELDDGGDEQRQPFMELGSRSNELSLAAPLATRDYPAQRQSFGRARLAPRHRTRAVSTAYARGLASREMLIVCVFKA